jgi:glycosyltransferase involved in cell wall biosynthesis
LSDGAAREEIGKAARERIIANFSEERMIGSYLDLYREVMSEN